MKYYVKAIILNGFITCEKNLLKSSLADRRGNNTNCEAAHHKQTCSIQARKAVSIQYYLPPKGQQGALADNRDLKRLHPEEPA